MQEFNMMWERTCCPGNFLLLRCWFYWNGGRNEDWLRWARFEGDWARGYISAEPLWCWHPRHLTRKLYLITLLKQRFKLIKFKLNLKCAPIQTQCSRILTWRSSSIVTQQMILKHSHCRNPGVLLPKTNKLGRWLLWRSHHFSMPGQKRNKVWSVFRAATIWIVTRAASGPAGTIATMVISGPQVTSLRMEPGSIATISHLIKLSRC